MPHLGPRRFLRTVVLSAESGMSIVCVCVVVIFGIYASETFPQMSKVAVDRLVLETEGVVSHDLAELFRQVEHCFISSLCDLLIGVS